VQLLVEAHELGPRLRGRLSRSSFAFSANAEPRFARPCSDGDSGGIPNASGRNARSASTPDASTRIVCRRNVSAKESAANDSNVDSPRMVENVSA
jgi:hypothetical protein